MDSGRTIFFSGVDRLRYAELLMSESGNIMFSPPSRIKNKNIAMFIKSKPSVSLVLDSGAFQGFNDVDSYCDLIREYGSFFLWYANLDVIGDQKGSNRNYDKLCMRLTEQERKKLLWVFQTDGDPHDIGSMDVGRLIGLGGLVPLNRKPTKLIAYLKEVGGFLETHNKKAHLFGVTNPQVIKWASLQNWFCSTDSTRWLFGLKSSEVIKTDGSCFDASDHGLLLTPNERARHNVRALKHIVESSSPVQLDMFSVYG